MLCDNPNPNYEKTIEYFESNYQSTKERLEKAKEEGASAQEIQMDEDFLAYLEAQLENKEAHRYSISKEGLAGFRARAQYISIPHRSLLLSSSLVQEQLSPLVQRFTDQAIGVDSFVEELNQLAKLVYQENK